MRGKIKRNALIVSLIASFLALTFATAPALAQVPAMSAAEIEDTSLVPGTTFIAQITVSDVEAMLGYQFTLSWDSSILTATAATSLYPFIYELGLSIGTGTLQMVYSYKLPEPVGFYGSRATANITFTVVGSGFSLLDLSNTILAPVSGTPIDHIVNDGYFLNLPVERMADLAHRRADAEHPVWYLSKWTTNTFTGYVKNLGTVPVKVKVEFSLTDGATTMVFSTNEDMVNPGKLVKVTVALTSADMFSGFGYYYWTARAWYDSNGDGTIDTAGMRTKIQHLDFLPTMP